MKPFSLKPDKAAELEALDPETLQTILDDIGEDCTEAGIEYAEALLGMLGVSVDLKTHFHALKKENAS